MSTDRSPEWDPGGTPQWTPEEGSSRRRRSRRIWAYAAAAWADVFAAVHVYWAVGGRLGLPDGVSITGALLVISIVAVPLCVAAAGLAVVSSLRPLPWVRWALVTASGLMLVHAAPTVLAAAGALVGLGDWPDTAAERFSWYGYEPYWLLGGVLFALAARNARRR